jgi:hypothetical protein
MVGSVVLYYIVLCREWRGEFSGRTRERGVTRANARADWGCDGTRCILTLPPMICSIILYASDMARSV